MKYYCGIGARTCPPEIGEVMTRLAAKLEKDSWVLRSGGAKGADQYFSKGVERAADIYLPFGNFEVGTQLVKIWHNYIVVDETDLEAVDSLKFHPAPYKLSESAKKMMMRNYRIVIGRGEPNSSFVVCWTEGGEKKGGTSQPWRIADSLSIPVFNLAREEDLKRINKYLE